MKPRHVRVSASLRRELLHEAGFRCGSPSCRDAVTLDVHHLAYVSEGGKNESSNLIALCPTCHAQHHAGAIPISSLRTWKRLLVTLNEGFHRRSVDILLTLWRLGRVSVMGEGVLSCAPLIASGLLVVHLPVAGASLNGSDPPQPYGIELSARGRLFVEAWLRGDQDAATHLPRAGV